MVNEDRPAGAGLSDRNRRRVLGVTIGAGVLTAPISLPQHALGGSGPPPEPPAITAEASPDPQTDPAVYPRDVLDLVNEQRKAHGCRPLVVNIAISKAAAEHSRDMGVHGYFAHDTPSGVTPWTRMEQAGYAEPAAENIALGYRTPRAVVDGWMHSSSHRENILDCTYKATGIGYYDEASAKSGITDADVNNPSASVAKPAISGPWWTQDFGYA